MSFDCITVIGSSFKFESMVGSLLDLFPQKSCRYILFAMISASNNSTSVPLQVQPELEGVTFTLGEIYEARIDTDEVSYVQHFKPYLCALLT